MGSAIGVRGMNATQLKYLACVFMVIDHIGMLFTPLAPFFPPTSLGFYLFRYVGRLAFPIFAFFAAEGCRKTRDYRRYLLRLGIFGAITHAVALVSTGGQGGSIIATFFLASLSIWIYKYFPGNRPRLWRLCAAAVPVFLAQLFHTDYGWIGAVTVVLLYRSGENRRRQFAVLAGCILFYYLAGDLWAYWGPSLMLLQSRGWALFLAEFGRLSPYFQRFYLPYSLLMAGFSSLSLLLLSRYNGARGNGNRWFFYGFYPIHLAALYLLSLLIP